MNDEDKLVKELPVIFVSISHPSEAITNMIERRKNAHQCLLRTMSENIIKINENAEEDIKKQSEIMKINLYEIKEDVKRYFIDTKFKLQNLEIEDDCYRKIRKNLAKFNQKESETVNEFCNFLRSVEKSRLQELKDLLKETKSEATRINHELPFILDELFENQIMEMNKITLSNHQHYADVERDLMLQVKNDLKLWSEELLEIKETLKDRLKYLIRKSAVFAEEFMKGDSRSNDLVSEVRRFNSLKSDFQFQMFGEDGAVVSPIEIEKWLREIQQWLGALDQSAKNIVQLYKSTITVLFHRYLGELNEIKKNIGAGVVHTQEVDHEQCEIYTPTADQLNIQYNSELQALQEHWGNAIQEMTDNINVTYTFLKGATCLWDRHFERIKELQVVVLRDLDNTIKINSTSSDCYEASLNIVLEELRQGSTTTELEKTLENAKKILNKMEQTYILDANTEVNVVLKYKTMMETGIEVLTTELKRFLTIHPPDYEKDPKKQRRRASQISTSEPEPVLPIQILYCVFQVGAVKNWMFGLWEAIDQYITACKQEIMAQVDAWINIQSEKIQERLKMKLMFHEPRFDHVKCANYEKRLKELMLHSALYENHKHAAEERKDYLIQYRYIYEQKCEDLCLKYIEECNTILINLPKTDNSYQARCYTIKMKETLVPVENEIKNLTDDYINSCTRFYEELKLSNYQFLSSARLFAEGGNFNMDEINDLYRDLKKLEDITYKDVQSIIKEINTRFWRYTSKIQTAETNLTSNLTDVVSEHEHNEKLVKKINKLHIHIQDHVRELQKLFNNIEKKLQQLNNEAKNNLGKIEYLSNFLPQFQNFLDEVIEVCHYVYHPEPVDIFTLNNNKLAVVLAGPRKSEFLEQLFNKTPHPERTDFISTMLSLLMSSFINVMNMARKFYDTTSSSRRLLDPTKLQPTYEDCMEEILRKYKPYLIQCEICWLENAVNFSTILNNIKMFKEEFLISFESFFYKECMQHFDRTIRDVMNQLKQDEEVFNDKLKQIYIRLKVLFGHPKNNEMLRQLQKDYDEIHADNKAKFTEILQPRKDYLDGVFEHINVEINNVRNTLPVFAEDKKIYELIEKLMLQITTKRTLLSTIIMEIDELDQIPINRDVVEHIHSYFRSSTNELGLEDSPHSQAKATSLATVSTDHSYNSADEFFNVLENTLNSTKMKMEQFVDQKLIKSLEDFKNAWDSDIKYILSLYKVKYDKDVF